MSDMLSRTGALGIFALLALDSACSTPTGAAESSTTSEASTATTVSETTTSTTVSDTDSDTDTDTDTDTEPVTSQAFYGAPPDMLSVPVCEPWLQDCPEGEKCVPYGNTGGDWNDNKCIPIDGDGIEGDPCGYSGPVEATDDCDGESVCFNAVWINDQLIGECHPFCGGSADDPICGPGTSCLVSNASSINLCMLTCDPLLQECGEGLMCVWGSSDFVCVANSSRLASGESCSRTNDCNVGFACASAEILPPCEGGSCCTPYCDLTDPSCQDDAVCQPFQSLGEGPQLDEIGLCALPDACPDGCVEFVENDSLHYAP